MNNDARSELDTTILGIELTLVSIIQGVALAVLIESASDILATGQFYLWPYVIAGLLTIFIFWSRAILHIITVIRWPLEFGHNFLYIACALVEALLFAQVSRPSHWFACGVAFVAIGWALFFYDLRLIRTRMRDSAGEASDRLGRFVLRDQWLNIGGLLPALLLFNGACAYFIQACPDFFIRRGGHLWLIALQVVIFTGYLSYVVKFYAKIAPLIVQARAEWHANQSSD
jgi:hypothetical protein